MQYDPAQMQMMFVEDGVQLVSSVRALQAVWQPAADGFHTQFGSAMQPVWSPGYWSGHGFWQVPWKVQAHWAAVHSVLVPQREHWKTHVPSAVHWHHDGRVSHDV